MSELGSFFTINYLPIFLDHFTSKEKSYFLQIGSTVLVVF